MNNDDTAEFISNLHIRRRLCRRWPEQSPLFFMFIASANALTINKYYDCVTNAAHSISICNLLAKQI